jgi:hypothetical protein
MTRLLSGISSTANFIAMNHAALQRTPALAGGARECACGGGSGVSGECEDCRKKRLMGERGAMGLGSVHRGGGFGGDTETPTQTAPVETNPIPVDQPIATAPAPVCDPDRALTWADFTGTPPQGQYAAKTSYTFPKDSSANPVRFRALLNSAGSWVKPKWKNPTNRTDTGAQSLIDNCKSYLKSNPNNIWSLDDKPDALCPASPVPDSSIEATKAAECDSKIGPELDRVAGIESSRLLAHEQLHFTISCVLVKKANASIAAGKSVSDIETKLSQADSTVTSSYDTETNHGCKSAEQTTWNNKVGNSLPNVKIE